MTVSVLTGDVRAMLATIEERSVSLCITSPPYYGLRSYSTPPQVWGGNENCCHDFDETATAAEIGKSNWAQGVNGRGELQPGGVEAKREPIRTHRMSGFCRRCQAWRGELGGEPDPDLFVAHLVSVFDAVRRVLRDDGCLVINISDSYSGNGTLGRKESISTNLAWPCSLLRQPPTSFKRGGGGIPAKSLIGVPERFFLAMQKRGWIVRSRMGWIKRSCMPESVTDRPTVAHESIFVFTKQAKYWWDGESIRRENTVGTIARHGSGAEAPNGDMRSKGIPGQSPHQGILNINGHPNRVNGRNYRTSDAYMDALDADIAAAKAHLAHLQALRTNGGPVPDDDGMIVGLDVNTEAFSGSHFAVFPTGLVRPFVLAACPERCCSRCGKGWERSVERPPNPSKWAAGEDLSNGAFNGRTTNPQSSKSLHRSAGGVYSATKTTGFRQSCTCPTTDTRPGTLLDPFAGSGTSGIVADELGRDAILIELSEIYVRDILVPRLERARAERMHPEARDAVATAKAQLGLFAEMPS